MANLLHIDSAMRTEKSRSRELSRRFADAWRAANPGGKVVYRDLAAHPIAHLDHEAYSANFIAPDERSAYQREQRALAEALAAEVLEADEIVLGMGHYNFGVPSTVKAWFDRLVIPGLTVGADGGLLGGRKLTVTAATGGGYAPGTPREGWDHREAWLNHAFGQLGLTAQTFISAELTLARESPAMIPMDLGDAEDASFAAARAAIDALFS